MGQPISKKDYEELLEYVSKFRKSLEGVDVMLDLLKTPKNQREVFLIVQALFQLIGDMDCLLNDFAITCGDVTNKLESDQKKEEQA